MQILDFTALDSQVGGLQRLKAFSLKTKLTGLFIAAIWTLIALPTVLGFNSQNWLLVIFMVGFGLFAVMAVYKRAGQIIRLRRFAEANQLTFHSDITYDGRQGLIFDQGHSRKFLELLSFAGDEFLEIANYRYTTGSGKHRTNHHYGFVQIKLPRRLPHMLLDARKNNLFGGRLSQLPVGFSKDQRISLEGDFDKYFTLYAPAQYKTDALYIFTPDVMQELIDSVHGYDVEIIDDNCYILTPGRLAMHDPKQLQEMLSIIAKIKPELTDQADYYADQRIADRSQNIIAAPGVRLRTGLSTSTKIIIGVFVVYFAWMFLGPALLSMLG